ncbi:TPA: hypothetical protein SBX51_001287 [Campylobacter coli]|nr:hypothetical protein [Campylobacter coli]HBK1875226.1 hypothetical protein [Campylobacter coli]HEF9352516.1 hypothetical protein [Campylobacter coli]HEF9448592.1 hypothetical protein [Campylobacter coli]
MKKIMSILLLSFTLLFADSFNESKKELARLYDSLGSDYQYDFYCNAPFKINKKGKYIKLKFFLQINIVPEMNTQKKEKSIKEPSV